MIFDRQPSKKFPLTGSGLLPPILILMLVKFHVTFQGPALNPAPEMPEMSVLTVHSSPDADLLFPATVTVKS